MTKLDYIRKHPESLLAHKLVKSNWSSHDKIVVGSGKITPSNKTSNLYKKLKKYKSLYYIIGDKLKYEVQGNTFAILAGDKFQK